MRLRVAVNVLALLLGIAFIGTNLAFEGLYRFALSTVPVPEVPDSEASPPVLEALWLAVGENPGTQVPFYWAWACLGRGTDSSSGQSAIHEVAHLWLKRQRQPKTWFGRFFAEAAVEVWLSRHATVEQLQRALAEWEDFGRGAIGISAASTAYFQVRPGAMEWPQLALLASRVAYGSVDDPFCESERALSQRALFVGQMLGVGMLSKAKALQAISAPLATTPQECVCKMPGRPAARRA